MRAPRLISMELEFFVYKFTRPTGVLRAIEKALGALIGADFGDVYSGGACGAVYSLQLSSMCAQDEWPGCAWRVLDAGLYLPGADRAAVFKAYDKLGGLDRLGTAAGGMLVDLVKLDADADGCERAQIALRLRYNAHIECAEADCEPLRRVLIRSDEKPGASCASETQDTAYPTTIDFNRRYKMAGIAFSAGQSMIRPGVYNRYVQVASPLYAGASDGIVGCAFSAQWGPLGEVIEITSLKQAISAFWRRRRYISPDIHGRREHGLRGTRGTGRHGGRVRLWTRRALRRLRYRRDMWVRAG